MISASLTVNRTAQIFKARNRRNWAGGSQPKPQAGKWSGGSGAAASLPSFAFPSKMALLMDPLCTSCARSWTGQFEILPLEGKGYPAATPGHLPGVELVTGTSQTYLCCVRRAASGQDLPSSVCLAAECCSSHAQTGCSWAACRLALGNLTGKSVQGRVHVSQLLGCTPETAF